MRPKQSRRAEISCFFSSLWFYLPGFVYPVFCPPGLETAIWAGSKESFKIYKVTEQGAIGKWFCRSSEKGAESGM